MESNLSKEYFRHMERRTITDAAPLKALAHPLRLDLLESLTIDGPGTATELADRLDDTPSNCSWHLRKLAEHGFVTEVEGATGRSRPWRASEAGLTWNEGEAEPETLAAGRALTEALLSRELARLLAAQDRLHLEPSEWRRDATSVVQSATWLTAEEAAEISSHLKELLLRNVERLHDPSLRPEGARLVSMVAWLAASPERRGRSAGGDVARTDDDEHHTTSATRPAP
jgi:DNA-binding transcriptional ArsR family regulator